MRSFLKIFFASLVALIVFAIAMFFAITMFIGSATSRSKPSSGSHAVLVLDLNQSFAEQARNNPLNIVFDNPSVNVPGLYDMVRMIRYGPSPIGRISTQLDYDDYRDVSGVKMPFKYTSSWLDGRDSFELSNVRINVPIDAAKFARQGR